MVGRLIATQRHRHPDDDLAALQARFDAREVVLRSGEPLTPETLVQPGWDVYFYRMPAPEPTVPHEIGIIHRDEDLIVVDKPPYLATMPRGRHITETVTVRLRRSTGIQELSPAHRLDRLTSGVLVFTVRPEVRGAYQRLFAERQVTKTYEAIARHDTALAATTPLEWASRMVKTPGEIQGYIVDGEPNARTTLADVVPLTDDEQTAMESVHGPLERQARYVLRPETGRTHQLRLHMWAAGVPILGDPVYPRIYSEAEEDMAVPMHLIARSLEFTDPLSGEARRFVSRRL
ncbi:hypothetical protein A605_13375 [Corynebacterium halotolerans YIM 70093 = DSM 44683]|uniref:RNA pseudouridylate synthase n=2 Tax=Corynebacterium halotolerans TaxID=225326 RepID=M1PAG3_9CORY|nr:hypothetical protein A605_13375 [Corynebacterium halotolerans YIM 70093 = DSM 44683]